MFENQINGLSNEGKNYINTQKELLVLRSVEIASGYLSKSLGFLIVLLLSVLLISFLSIALALYLGELWSSSASGFLAVGGIYAVVFLCAVLLYKQIFGKLLRNKIIQQLISLWTEKKTA